MAYCRQEGKDRIIFVTKEDHETPSNAELVADDPNDPTEDIKGSDCVDQFRAMQECMQKYPDLYPQEDEEEEEEEKKAAQHGEPAAPPEATVTKDGADSS